MESCWRDVGRTHVYHDRQMLPEPAHVLPDGLEQHLQRPTHVNHVICMQQLNPVK